MLYNGYFYEPSQSPGSTEEAGPGIERTMSELHLGEQWVFPGRQLKVFSFLAEETSLAKTLEPELDWHLGKGTLLAVGLQWRVLVGRYDGPRMGQEGGRKLDRVFSLS